MHPHQHQPMTQLYDPTMQAQYHYPAPQLVVPRRRTSGLAIAAMSTSIAGLVMLWPACIVGLILGHVAKSRIEQSGEAGEGMAVAGIVVGWIGTALLAAFFGIIFLGAVAV